MRGVPCWRIEALLHGQQTPGSLKKLFLGYRRTEATIRFSVTWAKGRCQQILMDETLYLTTVLGLDIATGGVVFTKRKERYYCGEIIDRRATRCEQGIMI